MALKTSDIDVLAQTYMEDLLGVKFKSKAAFAEYCDRLGEEERQAEIEAARDLLGDSWPRPIPVSERLPEVGDEVLVWAYYQSRLHRVAEWIACHYAGDNGFEELGPGWIATHWLPLPPSPEGE